MLPLSPQVALGEQGKTAANRPCRRVPLWVFGRPAACSNRHANALSVCCRVAAIPTRPFTRSLSVSLVYTKGGVLSGALPVVCRLKLAQLRRQNGCRLVPAQNQNDGYVHGNGLLSGHPRDGLACRNPVYSCLFRP